MSAWLVWLVAAGLLGVGEALSLSLVLGLCAVSAGAAAGVAALGAGAFVQVVTFVGVSVVLLGGLRPVARARIRHGSELATGVDALIGARGVAVSDIDTENGRIKIRGEVWSARVVPEAGSIMSGSHVRVLRIEGATAIVHASEL